MKQVIVIPKSATYEIQDKTYAWRLVHGRSRSALPLGLSKNLFACLSKNP